MAVEELVAVMAPPERPANVDDRRRWDALQAELGTPLPADWLAYGLRYGSGLVYPVALWALNPLDPNAPAEIGSDLALFRENQGLGCPYPFAVHPAAGGFLPWGSDDNGHSYGWLTAGPPDRWPVVFVGHGEEDRLARFDVPMTAFLARMLRGEYPAVWQADGRPPVRFVPGRDRGEAYPRVAEYL